jgi:PBP1b-binding outer membrane lipoprotein LpoB
MKKYLLLVLCFLIIACAPKMQSSRVSLDKSDELASKITDKWVAKDTELVVQDILQQIDKHKGWQRYLTKLNRNPRLFIAEVQNGTAEAYLPVDDLNDELLNEFSSSGDYTLIDAAKRESLLKEITYQNDGMVSLKQAKSIGKATGADLMIYGDIRMKPETLDGKTIKNYTVNLRATDIQTGEEVLRVRAKINKYSEKSGTGW